MLSGNVKSSVNPRKLRCGKSIIGAPLISLRFPFRKVRCWINENLNIWETDSPQSQCCVDTDDPLDGLWNRCDLLADVTSGLSCPATDVDGYAYTPVTDYCMAFQNMWVFNVADFVNVLYSINSTGVYNMQIRFDPLPLK